MSRLLTATAALALLGGVASQVHAQSFEGEVDYKITGKTGQNMDLAYMMKGDHIRQVINMDGRDMVVLMDATKHTMTMVMPQQQAYMTMDMNHMAQRMGNQSATDVPKITATGKTETIAGHKCEHYMIARTDEDSVDVCVAKGMGYYMSGGAMQARTGMGAMPSGANMAEWKKVFKDGFFPLKVTTSNGSMSMEATKVEPKSLPDNLFAPPAGYKEMQMGGMPGGHN